MLVVPLGPQPLPSVALVKNRYNMVGDEAVHVSMRGLVSS